VLRDELVNCIHAWPYREPGRVARESVLESTFVDLGDVRVDVSRWLTGVFGAELIIMETFGSDSAPQT
jgi:hypothetical protein